MGDAEALQAQAARVREQANALHRANQKAFEARSVEHGVQHDRAVRQADAARLEATKATAQADELDNGAKNWEIMAADLDQSAKEDAARGESRAAEENREAAEGFRTNGRADAARARDAREAAREQAARADALDQQVKDMDTTFSEKAQAIDRAADQLDDKARLMEEAVRLERIADEQRAAGKDDEVAATEAQVTDAWIKAEAIQPDLTGLDPAVLQDAGLVGTPNTDMTDTPGQDPGDEGGGTTLAETTETTAMRTTADIETEVAALRQRASRLHKEAATRLEASETKSGGERDEAAAEAWALRQKAKAADIQAEREHKAAMDYNEQARTAEAEAAALEAAGQTLDAEELREQVDAMRAVAKSHTQRAKDAEQRSQDATNQLEPLDQKVKDFDAQKDVDPQPALLAGAGDQLQDKARLLEAADHARHEALRLREAGDQEAAVEAARRAVDTQAQADALEPDFSKLDAASRAAAGIEDPAIEMEPESARPPAPAGGTEPPHIEMEPESARPPAPAGGTEPPHIEMEPESARPAASTSPAPSEGAASFVAGAPVANHQPATRVVGRGPDSDGDGLSDEFETNVFHSDPKERDPDGDGLNDWAEYWLDTKPKEADSDGDGWEDGEDLAFGDPLKWNDGGKERAQYVEQARRQFEQEGSDRDRDLVRDYLEGQVGTKVDDPDSDNDGLGDMVELQLKTNPLSPANSTADLDTARERLGERRWPAQPDSQDSTNPPPDVPPPDIPALDPALDEQAAPADAAVEQPSLAEPVYDEPAYDEPVYEEPAPVDAAAAAPEGEALDF